MQSQNELNNRKKALDEKLRQKQPPPNVEPSENPTETQLGMAFRLVADFVVFILVGAAMGFGLDILLKTSPWGMILLANLGFIGAIRNIIKKN